MLPELFADSLWQMSLGERAALEGLLATLRPSLAIEIGTAEGACLRHLARYAQVVHSFDFSPPTLDQPDNVALHTGDSHELLPAFLAELAELEQNVDFVLVDGDHTSEGIRRDVEDLLDSVAVAQTVILIHDTANERVRRGLDAVRFTAWPKVAHVELDWVPGHLFAEPTLRNELWYGLGLVWVDRTRTAYGHDAVFEQRYRSTGELLGQMRELVVARERVPPGVAYPGEETEDLRRRLVRMEAELGQAWTRETGLTAQLLSLEHRVAGAERALDNIKGSASWRMTQPLRTVKGRAALKKR